MRRHTAATCRGFILGTWVKAIGRALDAAGCNSAALIAEAGFKIHDLDGPNARCSVAKTAQLGIKVASHIKHTSFHALGYGMSASSTLKEAFERVKRYCHVVSDAVDYRFFKSGPNYQFVIEPVPGVPFESIDALVGAYLRMCRSLLGRDHSPLLIELRRPQPAVADDFHRLLRAPIVFGAEHNRLTFDAETIERPLDSGNPELARHSDAIANQYLARADRHNIEARVREVIAHRLEGSEPSQEDVAELLNVSARTLQRKLGDAGTSFKEILDETRRALALAYLSELQHSVGDVTYLLGFSCASSFTRAFRRWTGRSPSDWRGHKEVA